MRKEQSTPLPVTLERRGRLLVAIPRVEVPSLSTEEVERTRQALITERIEEILGNELDGSVVVGTQGLEPRFCGPEPHVLPLNDVPTDCVRAPEC